MARIRTIKPEFFRHADLYEAERDSGLPLRVAYAGLWTAADREGRFRWKPRELKLDCLPYDEVDFSRVLDALATRGFIVKYRVEGIYYGCIPSWKEHQVINNREVESIIPPFDPSICEHSTIDASATRAERVQHASLTRHGNFQGEGKGREREEEGDSVPSELPPAEPVGEDPQAKLFRIGKTTLISFGIAEKRTGPLIGQWLKQRNDPIGLLAAIQYARDQNVPDPVAYISVVVSKEKPNGRGKQSLSELALDLADEVRERELAAGIGRPANAF